MRNISRILSFLGIAAALGVDIPAVLAMPPRGEQPKRPRGNCLYTGKPGDTIRMSDRSYHVAKDGSFRRLAA